MRLNDVCFHRLVLPCLFLSLYCAPLAADSNETASRIINAVENLGHAEHSRRESASRTLLAIGADAVPALQEAAKSEDPEIAFRAEDLLQQIHFGLQPGVSESFVSLLRRYPQAPPAAKAPILSRLLARENGGPNTVLRLLASEPDAKTRQVISRALTPELTRAKWRSVREPDNSRLQDLLWILAYGDRDDEARDLVAVYDANSRLPDLVDRAEQQAAAPLSRVIAYAHRALNQPEAAAKASNGCEDSRFQLLLHNEAGHWAAVLESVEARPDLGDITWWGSRAACNRLLARTNEFAVSMASILRLGTEQKDLARFAAEALLANDDPDGATRLLVNAELYDLAASVLFLRRDYAALTELANTARKQGLPRMETQTLTALAELLGTRPPAPDGEAEGLPRGPEKAGHALGAMEQADALFDREAWDAALEGYRKAAGSMPANPVPVFMQGICLQNLGDDIAAREALVRAQTLPLANENMLLVFAEAVSLRNLPAEAARLRERLWRLSSPDSLWRIELAPVIAHRLAKHNKAYEQAVRILEAARVILLEDGSSAMNFSYPLETGALIAHIQALRAIEGDDADAAKTHIQRVFTLTPANVEYAIELCAALDNKDLADEADTLFNREFDSLLELCRQYDGFAQLHNETAWFAARCRRRLDEALRLAERAAALAPSSPEILDTLAEVLFQSRRKEEALALIRKCRTLAPENPYFRRQEKRMRSGNLFSDPEE